MLLFSMCLGFIPLRAQDVVQTLAGTPTVSGSNNGQGSAAKFSDPTGMVMDKNGNLFVADNQNHAIRKVTTTGLVTTLAGTLGISGSQDGSGTTALFNNPSGITLDANGNLYVSDTGNNTIRKITANGLVSTLAGLAGEYGSTNGTGSNARFNSPLGIAINSIGTVFVADSGNHFIRQITSLGVVTTLAGEAEVWGSNDGSGTNAHFNSPVGLAINAQGTLYVADANNYTIRQITPDGVVTTLAGSPGLDGSLDGVGAAARFCRPAELVLGNSGQLFVADSFNHTIRRIGADGAVTTLAGLPGQSGSTDGTGVNARFFNPYGLALDANGNLYISDTYNQTIRLLLVPFRVSLSSSGNPASRQISWDAIVGKVYRVQYKDRLDAATWTNLGDPLTAVNSTLILNDTLPDGSTQRFYRVVLQE